MVQPEANLVKQIKSHLERKHGAFVLKIHGNRYMQNGVPDLLCCVAGRFVGLEVKVPGKEDTVTKLQKQTIKEIRQAGGIAFAVTSIEEADRIVKKVYERISRSQRGSNDFISIDMDR